MKRIRLGQAPLSLYTTVLNYQTSLPPSVFVVEALLCCSSTSARI